MGIEYFDYKKLVKQIPLGKQLPNAIYIHESGVDYIPKQLLLIINEFAYQ